jgi:acyl-CoA synthetase (NDP forming)
MSQSGGVGVALAGQLSRLGVGISSFASMGSKLDVSGNDMLMWWEHDDVTKLAVLYLESFGNPRKFARTARRVGATLPVLTVHPASNGQSCADQALFEQAGVIATDSFGELTDTAALLAIQPVPAGRTVAIVSNVDGSGRLAADACVKLGLTVHRPRGPTKRRLRTLLPGGTVTSPVDTPAAVSAGDFRRCLELLAVDEAVDAMIALAQPTGANGDLITAIAEANADVPEAAAAAQAHAARYGAWRTERRGQVPSFPDVQATDARALVAGFLHREPGGGWLPPDKTADLLHCYGIWSTPNRLRAKTGPSRPPGRWSRLSPTAPR